MHTNTYLIQRLNFLVIVMTSPLYMILQSYDFVKLGIKIFLTIMAQLSHSLFRQIGVIETVPKSNCLPFKSSQITIIGVLAHG